MALSKSFATGQILTAEDVNTHLVNHVPNPGDPYDTGWRNVPLNSGYEYQGGSPCQVRRIGMLVHIRWGFSTSGWSGNTIPAVLPEGFRPSQSVYAPCAGSSASNLGLAVISTNGNISIRPPSTMAAYYLLNGITWTVD